jgi:voltage-gated potassium channel Kch
MAFLLGLLSLLVGFFRDLKELFSDRIGRAVLLMAFLLILTGTIFYALVEQWALVDSFYFAVVTLTTVGYGDLSPETTAGKLFTTVYILMGLSIIATFASNIAKTHAHRIARRVRGDGDDQDQADSADDSE